jgi:hypothetical protein
MICRLSGMTRQLFTKEEYHPMKHLTVILLICLAVSFSAPGAALDGRAIILKAGEVKSTNVPLALPCEAETDSVIRVVEAKTGEKFPATLRNNELVFIAEGAMPGTTHEYTVKIEEKDANWAPVVRIEKEDGDILKVFISDKHFTSYHFSNDWRKPFLWPVNSEGGIGVTRDWPMKEDFEFIGLDEKEEDRYQKTAKDHVHHKSLWVAYGDVNGVDCWGEGGGSGFQHSGNVNSGSGDAYGWIQAENVWQDKERKPIVDETREYRFYASPEDARILDSKVIFTATYGDVKFGDTKEGGLTAVRMRPELSYKWARITNALGDKGEFNTWGKPSPWCDYSGELKGVGWRGLTVMDHPSNLRHPTSWHVRTYGLMGANCFGYSYFSEKDYNRDLIPENGDLLLKKGESVTFHYRIYVHSGNVEDAAVADRYADYATPPAVSWKD